MKLNIDPVKDNIASILGLALLVLTLLHRQQFDTPELYRKSALIGVEFVLAFGVILTVLVYHSSQAIMAFIQKQPRRGWWMLLNMLAGGILLAISLWIDAPTLINMP